MKPSCVPFSGEISGSTAVIMPMPMNENDETASTTAAAVKSGCSKWMSRNSATAPNSRTVRSTP